jgi:uncharacterized cupin superfamily protein
VSLCKTLAVIIAAAQKKNSGTQGGLKIKNPSPERRVCKHGKRSTYTAVWKITPSAFSVYGVS